MSQRHFWSMRCSKHPQEHRQLNDIVEWWMDVGGKMNHLYDLVVGVLVRLVSNCFHFERLNRLHSHLQRIFNQETRRHSSSSSEKRFVPSRQWCAETRSDTYREREMTEQRERDGSTFQLPMTTAMGFWAAAMLDLIYIWNRNSSSCYMRKEKCSVMMTSAKICFVTIYRKERSFWSSRRKSFTSLFARSGSSIGNRWSPSVNCMSRPFLKHLKSSGSVGDSSNRPTTNGNAERMTWMGISLIELDLSIRG